MVAPQPDDHDSPSSYSSTVHLFLHTADHTYELADVGPTDATLRHPCTLPAPQTNAILEIIVDGRSERRAVTLFPTAFDDRIAFQPSEAHTTSAAPDAGASSCP